MNLVERVRKHVERAMERDNHVVAQEASKAAILEVFRYLEEPSSLAIVAGMAELNNPVDHPDEMRSALKAATAQMKSQAIGDEG